MEPWERAIVALLIGVASSVVGFPIVAFLGLYIGFSGFARGPSALAVPLALGAWCATVLAILAVVKSITRLPYRIGAFAITLVGAQASVFFLQLILPRLRVFESLEVFVAFVVGVMVAAAFVILGGNARAEGSTAPVEKVE